MMLAVLLAAAFEVASVKPDVTGHNGIGGRGVCYGGGAVSVRNMPLDMIIEQAYGIKKFQLVGGPAWLTSERFDIEAKPAAPVTRDECNLMVRELLAERFQLAIHKEVRQLPVYRLMVAKNGPKMRKVQPGAPLGIKTFSTTSGQLSTRGNSMAQLAGMLAITGELENQVIDATGLEGSYEFTLEWAPGPASPDANPGPSLFTALQEQLGLRLEAGKGDVEVMVVDRVNKVPTGN
jgi:uncharacterized protein (TIGR03435 family)